MTDSLRPSQDFYDDDDTGPPTEADDAWHTHNIASLNYPRSNRDPAPIPGQLRLPTTTDGLPPAL